MMRIEWIPIACARLAATLKSARTAEELHSHCQPRMRQNLTPTRSTTVLAHWSAAVAKANT